MAVTRNRVLPTLVSLTFDADLQICWRAIEALGLATSRVTASNPGFVREQLRRLYWLISEESGGICWRAPEAMAEIVFRQPKPFADYLPITLFLLVTLEEEDLGHFRSGALWAVGRLAGLAGDHLEELLPAITAALGDADPQVRGMAVWALQQAGAHQALVERTDLLTDQGSVDFYADRLITRVTVGELARRVLTESPAGG